MPYTGYQHVFHPTEIHLFGTIFVLITRSYQRNDIAIVIVSDARIVPGLIIPATWVKVVWGSWVGYIHQQIDHKHLPRNFILNQASKQKLRIIAEILLFSVNLNEVLLFAVLNKTRRLEEFMPNASIWSLKDPKSIFGTTGILYTNTDQVRHIA